VALDRELLQRIERGERLVAAMAPEACSAAAAVLRDAKPRLASERQRELAEEMAVSFEAQAARAERAATS
jgi:hypothetical protein